MFRGHAAKSLLSSIYYTSRIVILVGGSIMTLFSKLRWRLTVKKKIVMEAVEEVSQLFENWIKLTMAYISSLRVNDDDEFCNHFLRLHLSNHDNIKVLRYNRASLKTYVEFYFDGVDRIYKELWFF